MKNSDTVVATFDSHISAEKAIKHLSNGGFDIKHLSIVGKGYRTDEQVVGFYNTGDRIQFWGANGAFWGGLWGLLTGGVFISAPLFGPILVLGFLATMVISAVEGAVLVGGLSALGAALVSIGIPKNSIITYESAIKADKFLVMVHGSNAEVARAKTTLEKFEPSHLSHHERIAHNAV
jgi:hypothetical protein